MIQTVLRAAAALAAVALAYLLLWPVPIDPVAWTPPAAPSLTGPFAPNQRLTRPAYIGTGVDFGPEDVAVDDRRRIYAGMEHGRIVRFSLDGRRYAPFAETGGRPLGLAFDGRGSLLVADARRGLLSVGRNGDVATLATEADGLPFRLTNGVDVAADGTVYFSDASSKFSIEQARLDILEHGANGRLLAYDPDRRETRVLSNGLHFANGVAVAPDSSFVLVVETSKYRIRRYWLRGERAGTADTFVENLPGFPDGVSAGTRGIFWVALYSVRDPRLDAILPHPFLRKILLRLPGSPPEPPPYGFVLGIDASGRIVHNLQDPTGLRCEAVTSVEEHEGMLYLGTIARDTIARIPRP